MSEKPVKVVAMVDQLEKFLKHLPPDLKKLYEKLEITKAPTKKAQMEKDLKSKGLMTHIPNWNLDEGIYLGNYRLMFDYSRTAGYAIGTFLNGLKEGKILGRKCNVCGRILVPPRLFCEWCFKDTDAWVEVADTGIVSTYSVSYITTDPKVRLEKPIISGVVWLDGTKLETPSSKTVRHWGGFMHYFDEVTPENIKIGMKVKAVWEPPEKRKGSILDIKYFKPI
ncbi:MAG: Zn-ribbon domain-containing OB-fold protein [Candidatus Lokiarchaeia archaeon]